MRHKIGIIAIVISSLAGFLLSLYVHRSSSPLKDELHADTQHVYHSPLSITQQLEGDPKAGEKIYYLFCASCHGPHPQIELHAPQLGDREIWQAYAALGTETLFKATETGIGAMPARGGCFECSDEQLKSAILYMLEESS